MLRRTNKTRRRRLFVIFLYCVPTFCSDITEKGNDVHVFPADLASLCPYTSFCKENATQIFQSAGKEEPCCQPCSCESNCGLQYNCCFKHLDLYNLEETYQMVCKSLTETKHITRKRTHSHYRMINKCISLSKSSKAKAQLETEIYTFHPVYSKQTGFIYFNAAVAVCNNASKTVPFRKAFSCPSQEDFLTGADRFLQGLEPISECYSQYIPPDGVNLKFEQCEPDVIRKCNVTGEMENRTRYWEFCETFNATYIYQYGLLAYGYGNIYCRLCNDRLFEIKPRPDVCNTREVFGSSKIPGLNSLTVVLEHDLHLNYENTKSYSRMSSGCPVNEIIIRSFSMSCRPVKCPVLKVLLNNECEFYSKRLIGGPFVIYLRLVPALENTKLSRSFFDKMPEKDKNDKTAKWLKRKAMKRWNVRSFYHLSPDNINIDFLVVKATYPVISVNPKYIERTVDTALKELWLITIEHKSIALRAHLNEYSLYTTISKHELMQETDIHINEDWAYLPEIFNGYTVTEKTLRDELLHLIPEFTWKQLKSSGMILITKLFFCEQIDLFTEEYEDGIHGILFKVRNITLHTFLRVYTTDRITNLDKVTAGRETVRICLDEFPQIADAANSDFTFEVTIIALFSTINVLIKILN